jgi:CheY-like chemotaxis protein
MPALVFGDFSRVRQVLLNLIGNAVKFTQHGNVTVRVQVEEHRDNHVILYFAVTDTGIGIASDEQHFLFKPFSQVDSSSTRKFGGTGLGLAISKRFIEMMDGQIGFSSEKGKGSTFWFKLPFDQERLNSPPDHQFPSKISVAPIPPELIRNRKILIVEDSPVLLELATRQLLLLGITAHSVSTGKEALEQFHSGNFDVILMDVNLPDCTGTDVARAIRSREKAEGRRRAIIIAMTAGAMKGDREQTLEAGMDDYLAKPVMIEALKTTLEKWLTTLPEAPEKSAGKSNSNELN